MVSVIVPVFNVEPYIKQCLDSILSQTYKDLEIIVIDDGSSDGSGEICDYYEKKDQRIKVFHTENHGLSAARNLGINNSYGEYIFVLDSDDWIDENLIADSINSIGTADILAFSIFQGTFTGSEALCALINRRIDNSVWSKVYKRQCFSDLYFPEGRIMEEVATAHILLFYTMHVK